jgi:uncharacterized protein YbbC (DUF1343 family)
VPPDDGARAARGASARVRPGITVLLDDSIHLVRGKRVGLLTNHTGINEQGESDIDLLTRDRRAQAAGVRLVTLFAPEHGIRGTEDRENLASEVDQRTGLPIHSMYGAATLAPADSLLRGLDVLVFDLQDIGTRTWTYVGLMVYAIRSAGRNKLPIVVLDRPNPITGARAEGTLLDTAIANPHDPSPSKPGQAYALYPFPLRHGMTMGEMARFYNETLQLGAELHVVPMAGWRRTLWFDETGLPWVKPSPNMPSLTSALVYPAIVPFEGSNLSVGRGTPEAFQQIGAPWLRADSAARLLNDLGLTGVRFEALRFTPREPTDRKFAEQAIPGVRVVVTNRDQVQAARVGAALLWAVSRVNADSLRLRDAAVDLRLGAARVRQALVRGEDPDAVIDRELPSVVDFERKARRFQMYR